MRGVLCIDIRACTIYTHKQLRIPYVAKPRNPVTNYWVGVLRKCAVDPGSAAGSVAAHDVFRADRLCRTERPDGIEKVGKGDVDGDGECVDGGERSAKPQTRCGSAGA